MATSANAKIQIEFGQNYRTYTLMTNSGDEQVYTVSGGEIWSGKSGYAPVIRPNGVVTGRNMITAGATADLVHTAAFTAYLKGVLTTVSEATVSVTRATTSGAYKITSITLASNGSIAAVAGTEKAGGPFTDTRATAGGPPLIPTTSIEIGQIRYTGATAAVITATEIKQNGQYTERFDYPTWDANNIGDGEAADVAAQRQAHIKFASALPEIHTGVVPKSVYIAYYEPEFSDLSRAMDFTPAENSSSVSSTQYYGGTIGASSTSLGAGGFTALLDDGITDSLVAEKNQVLTVKFFPDEDKSAYSLTQGIVSLKRTYPVDKQNQATVTIAAEKQTAEFSS